MRISLFVILCILFSTEASSQKIYIADDSLRQCLIDGYPTFLDANDSLIINQANNYNGTLDCKEKGIREAPELAHFTSLTQLHISRNEFSDISWLSSLTALEQVYIQSNYYSSVPDLDQLTNLFSVFIGNGELSELPALPTNIQRLSVTNSKILSVDLTPYPQIIDLYAGWNNISEIVGLENLTSLRELVINQTNIESLPNFTDFDNLELIKVDNTPIEKLIGLETTPNLEKVDAFNTMIDSIGWIDTTSLVTLHIDNAKLTFEDILPFQNWSGFSANFDNEVQQVQGESTTVQKAYKSSWIWNLGFDQHVSTNYYLWYKDSVLIDSTTNGQLEINTIRSENAGNYACLVRNTAFTELDIHVSPVQLEVHIGTGAGPNWFSPNGDGEEDDFFIEKGAGIAKIFNEAGEVVREIETPGLWDGNDTHGTPVGLGYYIVIFENGTTFGITVIK